ncbi:MAG: hypothetical protein LC104_03190, partial [Bacteroidales bacterium]|nr:hypothetical protein [Bacteroidales bacterium]
MIFLSNVLAPSKTYTVRNWVYLQVGADRPGTLTINLQRSNRFGAKLESEAYGVEEDTEALLYGSRVFHLCKLSDGEVYE